MNAAMLFKLNPSKFRETAKGRTFEEFCAYLDAQPNFEIFKLLPLAERVELYRLSTEE